MESRRVAIIGSGPAGLTAAIYAARAGLAPEVFTGLQPGGQLTTTTHVENFPGFGEAIMGPALMASMQQQALRVGALITTDQVVEAQLAGTPKVLTLASGRSLQADTVIIATGATAKTLGLPDEWQLMGKGLSTCATCDGFFYKGHTIAVVGGGDSAMEEALYLANLARKVYLIHRREVFRASHAMLERAKAHANIEFLVPYACTQVHVDERGLVNGLSLAHAEHGTTRKLDLTGVFYAIGHTPNTSLFTGELATDALGYLKVHNQVETKLPGVFAAGDVADSVYRQAITAAGLGCQAAMRAARYLEAHNATH